jgi:hypothetical protein
VELKATAEITDLEKLIFRNCSRNALTARAEVADKVPVTENVKMKTAREQTIEAGGSHQQGTAGRGF